MGEYRSVFTDHDRKNITQFAFFLLMWSLYVFYPFSLSEPGISQDGVTYVHIARNLFLDQTPGWQGTWASPGYPFVMALLFPVSSSFGTAGLLVSKLMMVLLPVSVYLLARELFNSRIALLSAVLISFHPHFLFISTSVEPEMMYTTLLVFSSWAIWRTIREDPDSKSASRKTWIWAAISGVLAGITYQTRSEGLLIFVFLILAAGINIFNKSAGINGRRFLISRRIILLIVIVSFFILTSLPYILFLKETYGKLVLSPKSSYVQIWMKSRIYHDNDLDEINNPELWGLSNNGKLMWQEPRGLSSLFEYLTSNPQKNINVYLHNLRMEMPGNIPNNSGQWLYPQVYPFYFTIPALIWILLSFWKIGGRGKTIYMISPLLMLFVLPVFTEGWWKYLLPYSPFIIIPAAAGIVSVCERLKLNSLPQALAAIIVIYSIWTVKASPLVRPDASVSGRISMAEEQRKAGEWAKNRFPGTPNYMIKWSKLAHYLDGRWTAMPVTGFEGILWYARKNLVDYIVIETPGMSESQQLSSAVANSPDIEVAEIYESDSKKYSAVFFRIKR